MYIYFDNAASTPLNPLVLTEMLPVFERYCGNPSSIHKSGREAKSLVEISRKNIASMLNCSPSEIIFTSGGTEADNMAIYGAVEAFQIKHIITCRLEHHAVLHCIENLERKGRIKVSYVETEANGHVRLDHLERLLAANQGTMVSLMHANNEIGNLLAIEEVGELCSKYHAIFHSDTVQSVCHYPMNLQKIKVDFITGSAHKFHGPKGIGFLYARSSVKISPLIYGGSQERNMRGGTENVAGIVGMSKAMEIAHQQMERDSNYIKSIKNYMMERLEHEIPGVDFLGDVRGKSLYTILHVILPESEDAGIMLMKLDIMGIAASSGSACSSGSTTVSHIITALGKNFPNRPNIRFSFSKYSNTAEVDYVLKSLKSLFVIKGITA